MAVVVDDCGPEKTSQKGFCLSTLEKLMTYWPGILYLVIKSTLRVTSYITLMVIGYKYIYRRVLGFIATEVAGNTEPGDLYLSFFADIYLNISF